MLPFCKENKGTLIITLHVQPKARKTEIVGLHGTSLKVKLAAQPVDGAANKELLKFFAEFLNIAQSRIAIKLGAQSKHKVIEISGMTIETFYPALVNAGVKLTAN